MHNSKYTFNPLLMEKLVTHFDQLKNKYSKLLPIRIDFYYQKPKALEIDPRQAYCNMDSLCRKITNQNSIVGFAWVMEQTKNENLHFHAVFYVNGQFSLQYYPVYLQIEALWKYITQEQGYCYDCNRYKKDYKVQALKMINHYDNQAREALLYALSYLAKKKQKSSLTSCEMPVFGFSDVPQPSGRGRPRLIQSL